MSIVEYPSLIDVVVASLITSNDGVVLDGGVYNQSAFAQFSEMFVESSIFDGGSP
jgi:hypothetical protein